MHNSTAYYNLNLGTEETAMTTVEIIQVGARAFAIIAMGMACYFHGKHHGLRECKKIYDTAIRENLAKHLQEHMDQAFTDLGMVEIPKDQIPEAIRQRIEEVRNRSRPTKH